MHITSNENKRQRIPCIIRMLIFEVKFQKKVSAYNTRVNRFIRNIFYMIHSINSILRTGGGDVFFFLEEICDIIFGLSDSKIE